MPDTTDFHCRTCIYLGINQYDDKVCRRHAPVPDPTESSVLWPQVDPDHDWCGEHPMIAAMRTTAVSS